LSREEKFNFLPLAGMTLSTLRLLLGDSFAYL